jgi:hypothetical protein
VRSQPAQRRSRARALLATTAARRPAAGPATAAPRRAIPRALLAAALALFAALSLLATLALLALTPRAGADTGGAGQVEEAPVGAPTVSNTPFDRQGMWIWYVSQSEHGDPPSIAARARRSDVGTVYVKEGDGTTLWNQFNQTLLKPLHAAGLDVCAWQFVYGDHPVAEAKVAAAAVHRGADCFVIDAESEYEGKYAAADLYVRTLRNLIGANFPVSLAGFPYVDYHPAFPYSVFLGPGGATYDQPQMYWKAIGTSVRTVFAHTYQYNRIWGHPIYPIGQTYEAPGLGPLRAFRRFAASYGDLQPSWWDWQETASQEWTALGSRAAARPVPGFRPAVVHPVLRLGEKGDMVVWAQERLVGAGEEVPVTGIFGRPTRKAVVAFQQAHGLPADGQIGTDTWAALLNFTPYRVQWSATAASASAVGRALPARRPLSAGLAPRHDELGSLGAR